MFFHIFAVSPKLGFSDEDKIIKLLTNSVLTKYLIPSGNILSWNQYKIFNLLKNLITIWFNPSSQI